jgi:hypothetical protein
MTQTMLDKKNRIHRIVEMARAGWNYSIVAENEGVTPKHVSALAIRAGIRRGSHGEKRRQPHGQQS